MDYILGIDIGTGSTKAVSVNRSGLVIHTEQVAYPTMSPKPGYSEQAPEIIWQAFVKCIQRTVKVQNGSPLAISLSSAMHSLIAVDQHGTPLMNMITWADQRSAEQAERVRNSSLGEILYEQTGTPLHAMSPLFKLLWLKENSPDMYAKADKFISIKEFIWFKLFGVYEIDWSLASANGLFDLDACEWNKNALQLCELSAEKLSTPVSTSHTRSSPLADAASLLSVGSDTVFVIGSSDGCLANLGSFATSSGIAALTIGTSGAIRVASNHPTHNFNAMTFNYRLDENTFISGGPINNGGIVLKWYMQTFLKKELLSPSDYHEIIHEIQHVAPGAEGLIFLPYLLGERAPLWNSDACGAFFGIRPHHTQAHFTRAVVEGICLALYHIAQRLEESGLDIKQVHVSGGFVHSEEWLQVLADIFGKPIILIHPEDASALGAAYLAMKKLGHINSFEELRPKEQKSFLPREVNHSRYQEKVFPLFKSLSLSLTLDMAIANNH